jgi:hypothetical protein
MLQASGSLAIQVSKNPTLLDSQGNEYTPVVVENVSSVDSNVGAFSKVDASIFIDPTNSRHDI